MKESKFIELLNLYIDRQISPEEAARLEEEILHNPRHRRIYQQYCRMHRACTLVLENIRAQADQGAGVEEVAGRVGKDRTTVANTLRLLKLPPEIREHLVQSRMTSGHARAILSLEAREKQKELCALILQKGLSVREAEALAKRLSGKPGRPAVPDRKKEELESQLKALQDSLRRYLGTKVQITQRGKRGKVEIEYYSPEDLERIVESILGNAT